MKMIITLCVMALLASGSATAHGKSVTFYADGALVEQDLATDKGIIEIPLPSGMIEGSLRIKPGNSTAIQRVDIIAAPADTGKAEKELNTLFEQKNRLGDRLHALTTREEIFKAAAKSQSGKAPRKSKTNLEPMQSIRQGTEFAIAQLEAVYTARRKAEQEIRRLDSRIAAAKKQSPTSASLARIVCSPRGKVTVRYAIGSQHWTPLYDIYLNGSGNAQVNLSGQFPGTFAGYLLQASLAALADSATGRIFPIQPGPVAGLAKYKLPATEELSGTGVVSSFAFELKNMEAVHLPAGEANIYRNGEYVGRLRFESLSTGRSRKMAVGR
jgi:hypothetical protein